MSIKLSTLKKLPLEKCYPGKSSGLLFDVIKFLKEHKNEAYTSGELCDELYRDPQTTKIMMSTKKAQIYNALKRCIIKKLNPNVMQKGAYFWYE